ncbi:MAG TPA: PaaI family thioesterase [Acidimicrobiales bacterium]|nr:PaaI family thioesterase [Acidimicrobiales bacterium]
MAELPQEALTSWALAPIRPDARRAAKHELTEQVRRLINAVTMLDINPLAEASAVGALTTEVAALVERVEALPRLPGGPADAGGDDGRLLERSGIAGASNPLAPPLHLALDGERVVGWAVYPHQYEGPPGCVHGGFVAAAFDDLLGAAQTLSGTAGFTGTLTVRMVRPTPLLERIDYEGGVRGLEGRKIFAWGRARARDVLVAEAEGVFISPRRA